MQQSLLIVGFVLMVSAIRCQSTQFKQLSDIKVSVRWMEVDKMQQLYLIKDEHSIKNLVKKGGFCTNTTKTVWGRLVLLM